MISKYYVDFFGRRESDNGVWLTKRRKEQSRRV